MVTLDHLVSEAFSNASANGHDFVGMTNMEVCVDMMSYDANIELQDEDKVLDAIAKWRREHNIDWQGNKQ